VKKPNPLDRGPSRAESGSFARGEGNPLKV
jgi:hypothetical protein